MIHCALKIVYGLAALLVTLLFFSADACSAADRKPISPTHRLGVLLGGGIASYREDLVVPIGFDGPSFLLGSQYTVETARTSLQLHLRMSIALLKNRFSHQAYAAAIDLRPSWAKLLWTSGHDHQVWLGIALPLEMTNLLMDTWDDAHLYWLTTHSLAVVAEYHTRLPLLGYSVVRLDLPIAGLVSRPPEYRHQKQEALNHIAYHFSAPNKSLVFRSIWGYQSPKLQITTKRGSKGAAIDLGLELALDHCAEPKDIWGVKTGLFLSCQWRIGGGAQ